MKVSFGSNVYIQADSEPVNLSRAIHINSKRSIGRQLEGAFSSEHSEFHAFLDTLAGKRAKNTGFSFNVFIGNLAKLVKKVANDDDTMKINIQPNFSLGLLKASCFYGKCEEKNGIIVQTFEIEKPSLAEDMLKMVSAARNRLKRDR